MRALATAWLFGLPAEPPATAHDESAEPVSAVEDDSIESAPTDSEARVRGRHRAGGGSQMSGEAAERMSLMLDHLLYGLVLSEIRRRPQS